MYGFGSTSLAMVALATAAAEPSAGKTVRYAPAPAWVIAPPEGSAAPTPPGAPLRVIFADKQLRITGRDQAEYQSWRVRLLTPDGLALGNVSVGWSPANEEMVVHRLVIHRAGKAVDILASQRFAIIQRESNLEQSMLDGDLTATLQTAGLQVGDELEFAATKIHRGTALGEQPQGFFQLPLTGARGAYRLRILEPRPSALRWATSPDLPAPVVREAGGEIDRQFLLSDPASVTLPEGAPPRYAAVRLAQFSGYDGWNEVSRTFAKAYDDAARLSAGSPLKAEAARIAAATSDPGRRTEAALRLVQDQIRYVYVGLNGGNYRPAGVEETWQRRFGDCKGKTVLLIALLRELGIAAEAVLVSSTGGDGIDERLPTPALFDHVLVRATVNGRSVWLDGTRGGDRTLETLEPPLSRWSLPLRAAGAPLEPVAAVPLRFPRKIEVVEIDASAGFDKPGQYRVQQTLRGDEIFALRAQLAGVAPADADKMLTSYWREHLSDVEPTKTTWRLDEANRLLVLGMEGEGKVDWDRDEDGTHTHYLFAGGFSPPAEFKRPRDQPQEAAWANEFPQFACYATTIKLPAPGKGFAWTFSSKPVDRVLGGIAYWRVSSFDGQTARLVKSRRVLTPEISAREAARVNAAIAGFDNNKSYVMEAKGVNAMAAMARTTSNFGSFDDFAGPNPPCQGIAVASGPS